MQINFSKYQGTGNDFIIIDDREEIFPLENIELVKAMCDRRFGIGADGLMLLRNTPGFNFKMVYFNADGRESSMCGNGGRCLSAFAKKINLIKSEANFLAVDGPHFVRIDGKIVSLKMVDVDQFQKNYSNYIIHTGSPHFIRFVENINEVDVYAEGRKIRYSPEFEKSGINVNFVEYLEEGIFVRTYERGVEEETLSCGTGVTASALASYMERNPSTLKDTIEIPVKTLGGNLSVKFNRISANSFTDVYLNGPAEFVFEGIFEG